MSNSGYSLQFSIKFEQNFNSPPGKPHPTPRTPMDIINVQPFSHELNLGYTIHLFNLWNRLRIRVTVHLLHQERYANLRQFAY